MKVLKIAAAAIAAAIIGGLLVLSTFGLPAHLVTAAIADRVERDTGYRIAISGATRIGLWSGLSITTHDVTLRDPKDSDVPDRLTIGSVQADLPLRSVLSGRPIVSELIITRPVLHLPLLRERTRRPNTTPRPAPPVRQADAPAEALPVERVTISDGVIAFSSVRDHVENRLDGLNVTAEASADRKVKAKGSARLGDRPLKFEIRASLPPVLQERQTVPVELALDAPGLLQSALTARAELRLNGAVLMINGLTGALGDGQFTGWASADLSSKPLVKLDLDFQRLDIAARAPSAPASGAVAAPWSDAPIDLDGLNYVDAQVRFSAAELNIGETRVAPAAVDATLASGIVKATLSNLEVYGGQANASIAIDVSSAAPSYAMNADIDGVRALPLLSTAADFDKIDGKLQAKLALRSSGASQRAIMSNLGGTAFANFQDGEIRGINVAKMIRSLTASTLSGWQESKVETTDLTQLSASFTVDKGQATTSNLVLVGPLVRMTGTGAVDLGAKSMAFRVEPKLVLTTEGQGGAADPVGLGIPVVIQGPWANPRIYPDMAGILDNPDAAYAKLRDMGKGLFGDSGGALPGGLGGKLGETLGTMIQQGLGASKPAPSDPAKPQPPAGADTDSPMNGILKQLFGR